MYLRKIVNATFISSLLIGLTAIYASAQECPAPSLTARFNTEIPFTPQQEADLGDLQAEKVARDYRLIDDSEINVYLTRIVERLVKNLPLQDYRLKIFVVDLPDPNAFAIAGGRIYVTRKLISLARSEDELASVIAHELGHTAIRHAALTYSRLFKQVIGVSQFSDRADIAEKYNRLLENANMKTVKFPSKLTAVEQLEADRAGIYTFVAAGYDPIVYTSFWKRLTEAKKTSFFSQVFGTSNPADKRLSDMLTTIKSLPPACLTRRGTPDPIGSFAEWRTKVLGYSKPANAESLNALIRRQPLVPIRPDIANLNFSPNGELILASDGASVAVLGREPFKYLFRVEGDGVRGYFSPDSRTLSVIDRNLRVERWDIATKSLISVNELFVRDPWQTEMSPDGRLIAAYLKNGDLVLYDVATNDPVFTEKNFYEPGVLAMFFFNLISRFDSSENLPIFNFRFSPDGRSFIAARNLFLVNDSEKSIAVDLSSMTKISLNGNVKSVMMRGGSFAGPDSVVGQIANDLGKSGMFAYPSGERLAQFELSGLSFRKSGNYIAVRPVAGAPVGLFDIQKKRFVLANKNSALDVYGNNYVAERKTGELGLYTVGTQDPIAVAEIPPSSLSNVRTSALSPDGKYFAGSVPTRGAIWDLDNGKRLMHVRGFNGSFFTADNKLLADFPKSGATERTIARIDPATATAEAGAPISDRRMRQSGRYLISLRGADETAAPAAGGSDESSGDRSVLPQENTVMEIRDAGNGSVLWSRKFPNERPDYTLSPVTRNMVLLWPVKSKAAAEIIKASPELTAKAAALADSSGDYLIEVVDPQNGTVKSRFLFESGKASIEISAITAIGDYLVVADEDNRVLVYSLSSGQILWRFFGGRAVVSTVLGMIAVENFPGSVTFYDIATGAAIDRVVFSRPVVVMQFADERKQFFALTDDQTAYSFDATRFGKKSPAP